MAIDDLDSTQQSREEMEVLFTLLADLHLVVREVGGSALAQLLSPEVRFVLGRSTALGTC
jgi:hypothetical protein